MLRFDEFNALVGLDTLRRTEADKMDFARDLMARAEKGGTKPGRAKSGAKKRRK